MPSQLAFSSWGDAFHQENPIDMEDVNTCGAKRLILSSLVMRILIKVIKAQRQVTPFQVDMSKAHQSILSSVDILPAWDDALRRTASLRGGLSLWFSFLSSVSALCLVLWCIILLRNSRYRLLWPPVCWLVLVFLSYGLWRYRLSDS